MNKINLLTNNTNLDVFLIMNTTNLKYKNLKVAVNDL